MSIALLGCYEIYEFSSNTCEDCEVYEVPKDEEDCKDVYDNCPEFYSRIRIEGVHILVLHSFRLRYLVVNELVEAPLNKNDALEQYI